MTRLHIVVLMLASMVAVACHTPELTHCPEVDCPKEKVCDGHGGCAFPEQLDICKGHTDGDPCTYKDQTGTSIDGECTGDVCYPLGCGNKFVTPDEACDDGNNQSGDGCSADCRSAETCGNGIIDTAAGEQCDDGNTIDGDGCQSTCLQPRCGDSVKDVGLDEECDAGPNNSTAPNAACRPTCQLPRCGDGVLDTQKGEVCDDGNNQAGDGCSGDCKSTEFCGNGVVDPLLGEVCDDGNTVSGDGCAADCKSLEVCGNNVLDTSRGEVCDDGNTVSGDGCSSDCKSLEVCGNMIIDAVTEQCDLGSAMNSNAPDSACRTNCKLPRCGDTIIDPMHGEQCDNGLSNADAPNACRTNCQNPRCGDAIKDTGEVCDDGNTTSGDGCSANCGSLETCGNSIIDVAKGEQCDNGGANSNSPNAACRTSCQLRQCGDMIVDTSFGEACDQGAANSNLPGATCRTNCTLQRCGDGILDSTKGEICDDGNTVSGDGCAADCHSDETCGNAVIDTAKGEQCDAGSSNANTPNAPCRTTCVLPRCGDNVVDNTLLGEGCDMGAANSNSPNAACRTNCQLRRCGDGVVDTTFGEVCDDGNVVSGDGCSADCKSLETCGNTIVDTAKGEQCDKGAANSNAPNAQCRTNCQLPKCGDSIIDNLLGETCDLGASNSNAPNATCRTNCQPQRCGDTIIDNTKGEICDDGNNTSGDGCSSDCTSNETCGNGITDTAKGEQCDNGGLNSNSPNATCRTTCLRQKCGDSIIDNLLGEACDLGASNSNSPNATCRTNCQPQRCGDGILDNTKGEVCDDGNNTSGDGCSSDCKSNETCGNSIIDTAKGEQCDNGGANSNAPNAACRTTCLLPKCGDGIVDTARGEVCDAGASNSMLPNAPCRPTCVPPTCGDGVVDTVLNEVCDDGNTVSGDGCSSNCKSNESCGNGTVDYIAGEQCDDGNTRPYDGCSACQPEIATVYTPGSAPPARDSEVLVYDGARQRVVMFGGRSGAVSLNDTWEWDGTTWKQMQPAHAPSPRYDAAAAYDAIRHRVVLFGGTTPSTGSNTADTWEYDGVDWKQFTPTSSPPGRAGAAAAFNPNNTSFSTTGHVIIFGGTDGTTTYQDTYEWTGTTWNLLAPTTKPGARWGARMAFDSASTHNYVLLFGGSSGDNHTWTFDGSNWTDKGATAGPTTGADAVALAFDANLSVLVLWGGVASTTYSWSGTAWSSSGTATPSARSNIVSTYDAIRKQIVLFGGKVGAAQVADTWTRSSTTWAQPAAFSQPPARMRAGMGYDPLRHKVVLFGGQNLGRNRFGGSAPGMTNDTWEWDGHKWSNPSPTGAPTARGGTFMDYDTTNKVLRLYGGDQLMTMGANTNQIVFTDVYSYNGTAWTNNSTTGRGVARTATMAYDMNKNQLVTFSGAALNTACGSTCYAGGGVGDTWTWDTTNGWKSVTGTLPPGRRNAAMAYDPVRKRSVAFGGLGTTNSSLGDTWEWNGTAWSSTSPTTGPSARSGHQMFYNSDVGRVTVFGSPVFGLANGEDLWEWNVTDWVQRTMQGTIATEYHRSATYDSNNHTIVTFGGRATDLGNALQQGTILLQYHPNSTAEACTSAAVDYDNDGKAGCNDDECWAQCTPLCPPLLQAAGLCPAGAPKCGDGICQSVSTGLFEDCNICPSDCGACTGKCGDFHCDSGETHALCPNDC